jgi:formylglycine-generating enzyme required for sulfatase activity
MMELKGKCLLTMGIMALVVMALGFGCGNQETSSGNQQAAAGAAQNAVGSWQLQVDLDQGKVDVADQGLSQVTTMTGHTVEIKNGPTGCSWNAGTYTLTCEFQFRNLAANLAMKNVRTKLYDSTNPSAIMTGADYIWSGSTISAVVPNSALSINDSGYCITQSNPSSAGSSEGCTGTWLGSIPPGAIATQKFVFTNVTGGKYKVWLKIMADYSTFSAPAEMSMVPAGCFNMGDAFSEAGSDERPVHNVCITSDLNVDVHEVTNEEYAACVTGGGCTAPSNSSSATRASYYGNPTYNNFPVIYVDWSQATSYCTWAGKRLPTEAEWEYAARGGLAGARYPWRNTTTPCVSANYDGCFGDTKEVGSYPANGFGLYDAGGNVREWVNDWYQSNYYGSSPTDDPTGPASGSSRVVRGGDFITSWYNVRVSFRDYFSAANKNNQEGFRCAQEPTPPGMAKITAGCFNMGDAFSEAGSDERPVHNVCITSDFNMDVHETTNAEYAACVTGGGCTAPSNSSSATRASYYGNPTYNNFPVVYVDWSQAKAYCTWAGKRLPTEAEWEYAARGKLASKRYPWGDAATPCVDANYNGCVGDTKAVGSYPANGFGLYDVGGNVREWVNDWYQSNYYSSSPTNDPPGPVSGSSRVVRGGDYSVSWYNLRVSFRDYFAPANKNNQEGFRCAGD